MEPLLPNTEPDRDDLGRLAFWLGVAFLVLIIVVGARLVTASGADDRARRDCAALGGEWVARVELCVVRVR